MEELITTFNAVAFLFHIGMAAACGWVGDPNVSFPLYLPFTTFGNATTPIQDQVSISYIGTFPMTAIFVTYFTITAFCHLGNLCLWKKMYMHCLEDGRNPFRWTEYAITAPLMTAVLAYISGSRNFLLIVAACTLTFTTMTFGFVVDELRTVSAFFGGLIPFLVEFAILISSLYVTTACYPGYVPATIFSELILWCLFPSVMLSDLMGMDYKMGELWYIFLSLASKGVLAVILLANDVLTDGIVGTC